MNLRSNYNNEQWAKFLASNALIITLLFTWVLLSVNYFLMPMIEIIGGVAKFLNEHPEWLDYFKTEMVPKFGGADELLIFVIMGSYFIPFSFIAAMSWSMVAITSFLVRVLRKLNLLPTMRLCIIKNDKQWFTIGTLLN